MTDAGTVNLGRSGLKVSRLCLGTMMFGGPTGEAEAREIVASARGAGINFLDTADVYNGGAAEDVVGRAVRELPNDWIVATKVGNPMGEGPNARGLSRRRVIVACEASLRRLGLEAIDVYYLHKEDPETPLEETVSGLAQLLREGKIRYIGLSNFRAWRIAEAVRLCDQAGIERPVVCQPYYNAMNRMPEVEVLPACAHYGLGVVPYSPLARGVLTAKYPPAAFDAPDADSRAGRSDPRMLETEWRRESLAAAQRIREHAEAKDTTAAALSVAWVLANPLVTSVLAGPRTLQQWQSYLAALEQPFDAGDEALFDALVPPGHPSTPGYTDPKYPVEGRPAHG